MQCQFCGKEESLPFVCNYCGGVFCPDHRLPEAHQCKGDLTQKRTIVAPPQTTFSWQTPSTMGTEPAPRQGKIFSTTEIRDIVIAWFALGVAFSIANFVGASTRRGQILDPSAFGTFLLIALVTIGPGFVFHELSHKFVAQRYGFWAEFRMWPMGLILALITSLLTVIFAAPGATYINGMNISQSENGKISLAGPIVNVAIAVLFLPLDLFGTGLLGIIGFYGTFYNIFLAVFNLIPIGPLDGSKVFRWSLPIWALTFAPLAIVLYFGFFA